MKIYLAHPISGLTAGEVLEYYDDMSGRLELSYEVLHPMLGKNQFRTGEADHKFTPGGYVDPVANDHAIVLRDLWMVRQADIVLIDLQNSKAISIGCVSEMAWAYAHGKLIVLVMEEGNLHEHAFVLEQATHRFKSRTEAIEYLLELAVM